MSFSSSVDNLMVASDLSDILKHAFGGIDKILSGKKFPQNVRVFSMQCLAYFRHQRTVQA